MTTLELNRSKHISFLLFLPKIQNNQRDSNINQTTKRPRPPPPPPRSGSWTSGKTIAATSTSVDDCAINQRLLGKYARESPSPSPSISSASSLASGAQMKMTTCSSDSTTAGNVNYSTQQQQQQQHSCTAHQMHNPTIGYTNSNTLHTSLMNGYTQPNQHLNYHIPS
ncbi:unnamed protein product [Trichobilharzia regenti]|nr:unnamed protein product [Trichobilharzia regenti]